MAQPSYVSTTNPVAVISPQLCAPYPVNLIIVRKVMTLSDENFSVTDVNGNVMFKVKSKLWTFRNRRVLLGKVSMGRAGLSGSLGLSGLGPWKVGLAQAQDWNPDRVGHCISNLKPCVSLVLVATGTILFEAEALSMSEMPTF
ncbi:hypothetical protein RJ639_047191 [Escallonia herrerae]|uniref:Uncharacterized protein n=1 Tax=Escallonia herrerae TaxID=1293975 RepID=A0AA89AXJ3_9ASTE|nr:hypothetical protein RJ639_047191 [Escallonia herrerae]